MSEIEQKPENNGGNTEQQQKDPATGRFLPGNTMGGNKKGSRWLSKALEEAILKVAEGSTEPIYALLLKRVIQKAIVEGDNTMIQLIYDRMEGKAPQTIDFKGEMQIVPLSEEQKLELLKLIGK